MAETVPLNLPSPSRKSELLIPKIDNEKSVHHWNQRMRIKWMFTYFFGCLLIYAVRSSISICATAIGKDLGWDKHIAGMALSAFFCGYITTNVLGGYLADRYGGEIVMFYTGLGWGTLTLAFPMLAHSNTVLGSGTAAVLAARFLTGVCQGVFFPSLTAILTKHVPVAERGFVYSFSSSGSSVGTIVTGLGGSLIIDAAGWPMVFIIIGLLSLLWLIWLRYLHTINSNNDIVEIENSTPLVEPIPWRTLALTPSVWALVVSFFCSSYCFYNLLAWTPVYFHDLFPESKGWVFNVVPWLLSFLLANTAGYTSNILISSGMSMTLMRKLYACVLFIGTIIFSLMLTSVETFRQALFVMSFNVGANALSTCSLALNPQDIAPKHAGALLGFINSCGAFAGFVGVYLTGHMLETTGNWSSVFYTISVVSFIGLVSFTCLGSAKRVV